MLISESFNQFISGAVFGVLLGGLLGIVFTIYRRYLLRIPRLLGRRLTALPRKTKVLGKRTGTAGLSSHPKVLGDLPAILRELHVIDDAQPDAPTIYDFSEEDRQLVTRRDGFKTFKQPNPEFLKSTEDNIDSHAELAQRFFSSPIQIETNADNLYDEEEGAVLVQMLRRSDRPMLYAIDKFRCVVGDNARRMVLNSLFAVIWIAVVGLVLQLLLAFEIANASFKIIVGVAALIALTPIMVLWLRTNVYYSKARDTGFSDFKALLQSYFAGVSDKFVNAHSKMSHAILGEAVQDSFAENAEKSHKVMLWHAFRILFMENFLRNEYYQIRRNLRFYQVFYVFGALVAAFVLVSIMILTATEMAPNVGDFAYAPSGFVFLAGVFGIFVWWRSIGRKDSEHGIAHLKWRGFEHLHMDKRMREIIGAYAKEAGIGKNRFTRG